MLKNLPSLFMKFAAGADTYLTLAAAGVAVGQGLTWLAALGVGIGTFATIELFQDWAKGKTIDEVRDHMLKSVLPAMGSARDSFETAAEDLAGRYHQVVAEMREDDARRPFAVLFGLMAKYWDDQTAFRSEFDQFRIEWLTYLEQNDSWQIMLSNWLVLHQQHVLQHDDEVIRQIDFTRDDIVDLSNLIHLLHDATLQQVRAIQNVHIPPLTSRHEVYRRDEHGQKLVRFVFTHRRFPQLGRATDIQALRSFLITGGKRCRWWLLTAPGGSGKSRLALETVLWARSQGWFAGFLKDLGKADGSYEQWQSWEPDRPTLIVIDYAARRARETGAILRDLIPRSRSFQHPVRVLLLERQRADNESWWKDDLGGDTPTLEDGCHLPPRELTRLNDDELWHIIRLTFEELQKPLPSRAETLNSFRTLDADCRPLMAALFAETLARDPDSSLRWDKTDLVGQRQVRQS